jgi:hypothetical protein
MIRNPDFVVGMINGEISKPDWYKTFLFVGTDSKITQHRCLYEGKVAFEKLANHVIIGQITVKGEKHEGIELTPTDTYVHPLKTRKSILSGNKIWRFMNLFKFESLINTKTLHFARIDQFKDKLEGITPISSIESIKSDSQRTKEENNETLRMYKIRMENNRKSSFACCWHINDTVNYDLWNEYGGGSNQSIAIQTNAAKLDKVLKKTGFPVLNEPIQYFEEPYFNQNVYWFPTLFKRAEYNHEREFRSILFVHGFELNGLNIKINPEELIRKIYVHPDASKDFFKKIRFMVKESGLRIPVTQKIK